MLWLYMLLGASAGLLSGLLGIGGGLLVVPGLAWVFHAKGFPEEVVMHFAVGTSMGLMVLTTTASTWGHMRRGVPMRRLYQRLVYGLLPGVVLGAGVGHGLHSDALRGLFGVVVLYLVVRTTCRLCGWGQPSQAQPRSECAPEAVAVGGAPPAKGRLWPLAGISGVLSGMLGVGSGALAPMLLHRALPVRAVVGVCAACSLTVAVLGSLSQMAWGAQQPFHPMYSVGYVFFPAVVAMALTSPLAAWAGTWLSHRVSTRVIQWFFVVLLTVVGGDMLWPMLREGWQYVG